jgi:hypothetical protein
MKNLNIVLSVILFVLFHESFSFGLEAPPSFTKEGTARVISEVWSDPTKESRILSTKFAIEDGWIVKIQTNNLTQKIERIGEPFQRMVIEKTKIASTGGISFSQKQIEKLAMGDTARIVIFEDKRVREIVPSFISSNRRIVTKTYFKKDNKVILRNVSSGKYFFSFSWFPFLILFIISFVNSACYITISLLRFLEKGKYFLIFSIFVAFVGYGISFGLHAGKDTKDIILFSIMNIALMITFLFLSWILLDSIKESKEEAVT